MLAVFGAGGLTRQIIDFLPEGVVLLTDDGGPDLHGLSVLPIAEAPKCDLVIAVNAAAVRQRVSSEWPHSFGVVQAGSAEVSRFARIDEGAILCRQAIVEADVAIGCHFVANLAAFIGHETHIGDFVTVGPRASICGNCRIGDGVSIGAHALIKQGIKIGDGATICMGAVVNHDVPPGVTTFGARALRATA